MRRLAALFAFAATASAAGLIDASPAWATDVSMSPTPYENPYAVEQNKPPYAFVYFYDVDHVETYTLFIDDREYRTIHITADLVGRGQYTYRFRPPWGSHTGYVEDSSGDVVADFFEYSAIHVEFHLRLRPNPVRLYDGERLVIRICYDVDKPDYDFPNTGQAWINDYRHWNAIRLEDGACTLVDRWDGSNDWGDFAQPGFSNQVIHAATRFGPYRFEEFRYVTDKKAYEIDFG